MTRRTLTQIERRAIWEVGGKACAYCGDPLEYSEVEVDHIIPQSVEDDLNRWAAVRQEYQLDATFDLNGLENFAPSCSRCNGRKSSFLHGRIAIELATASRLKDRTAQRIEQLIKQSRTDNARFSFSEAVRGGTISEADIYKVLSGGRPATTSASAEGSLERALVELQVGDVSEEDVDRILNMRVDLPEHAREGLALSSGDDSTEVLVTTITQYQSHIAAGYYARTSFDMYMAGGLYEVPYQILTILQNSRFPDASFINNPHRGIADMSLLPGGLLCYGLFESEESHRQQVHELNRTSISELVATGDAVVKGVASELLVLEAHNTWTLLKEILRTDVDRDGLEELVILRAGGPLDGTFRSAEVLVLKRMGQNAMFEQLNRP